MNQSIIAWLLWILFLIAGALWVENRSPQKTELVASGPLPRNTLLLPGPSVPSAFAQTYIVAQQGAVAGQTLTEKDVSSDPLLPSLPAGTVLVSIPVDWSAIAAGLNAGSKVALCRANARLAADVVVQLVQCAGSGSTRACTAVVALPTSVQDALDALAKPGAPLRLAGVC